MTATDLPRNLADPGDPDDFGDVGDLDAEGFRTAAHQVVDVMADYLATIESRPVFPPVEPGAIAPLFPASAPERSEGLEAILADYHRLIEPNATAWQSPGFMAYFPTSASVPGILGEMLTAAIGQNLFLWRTSPIGTELEMVVISWFRQAFGLPEGFDGFLNDTASTSSLIALAAARERAGLDAATSGLAARPDLGQPRIYASTEAHSSIEKAAMTLGLGRAGVSKIPVDDEYRLRPDALAAAIDMDRAEGRRPIAICATLGTTSSTSVDPVAAIADVAERESLWLHVDAAYAGAAALLPEKRELFAGWERADSIVVNPHKWLYAPFDASILLTRRMPDLRAAFSLVPEYLRTLDRASPVRDVSEYTPQLGRRFRSLKLWLMLRWFGLEGLRSRLRDQLRQTAEFTSWVDADPDWERLAPVPFSTVCFRHRRRALAGRESEPEVAAELDERNARILEAVNATGEVFLSHTRLRDRFAIRVSLGQIRTEDRHVARAWELLRLAASSLD